MPNLALILGASIYADPQVNSLPGAEPDARRMTALFATAGFEILPFIGPDECRPDRVRPAIDQLAERLGPGDTVAIYAAMHATLREDKSYLVYPKAKLFDLQHGQLDQAISVAWLESITGRPGVRRFYLLDACRRELRASRQAGPYEDIIVPNARDLVGRKAEPGAIPDDEDEDSPLTIFSACERGAAAQEIPALQRGLFTLAFENVFEARRASGRGLRLDDDLQLEVEREMIRLAKLHQLVGRQRPHLSRVGAIPVLLAATGTPSPTPAEPSVPSIPSVPAVPSIIDRLREESRTRAQAPARRRAAYDRLHPAYLELRHAPHVTAEELHQAWAEVCRECGLTVIPSTPGELEWTGQECRAVPGCLVPATREKPFVNSLGMRFVPVPMSADGKKALLVSVWETRVQDYEAYAKETPGVDGSWKNPVFEGVPVTPGPTHPVVYVDWDDSKAFCAWLTRAERTRGLIPDAAEYRLLTDSEWSWAVGIGEAEDKAGAARTPKEKHTKIAQSTHPWAYPWGPNWPPTPGAGNYVDRAFKSKFPKYGAIEGAIEGAIDGYDDGHAATSPVDHFPPNRHGLKNLGGNTWEWCEDFYNGKEGSRVLRGGSWYNFGPTLLLSSCRYGVDAGVRLNNFGFRVALVGVAVR